MDEKLLAEAMQAQERLIEAEHDAEVARAEFHRAVRRLHLHGWSLREVAAALGLSHQRVHQIIEAAGGCRRWGRRRVMHPDLAVSVLTTGSTAETPLGLVRAVPEQEKRERCSFCGKHRQQLSGLAAIPAEAGGKFTGHTAICADCLSLCTEIITEQLA